MYFSKFYSETKQTQVTDTSFLKKKLLHEFRNKTHLEDICAIIPDTGTHVV